MALVLAACGGGIFLSLRAVEKAGGLTRAHKISESRQLALELRVSLTLLFGLVALAQWAGVSPMIAGFGLGLVVAAIGEPRRLAKQMFALTEGFFAPIYFVWLGAGISLRAVAQHPGMLVLGLLLGVGALLVHAVMRVSGQALPAAVLAAAQIGVPAAAVSMGSSAGIFPRRGRRAAARCAGDGGCCLGCG